jgi:hypothetical protein
MYRCLAIASLLLCLSAAAPAQLKRNFPADALRGELVLVAAPEARLNGRPARLAPGVRIRGQDNLLQMSAGLTGARLQVHYTLDTYGLVRDVWVLRPDELQVRPWPRNATEAATWRFDPIAQTWSRP